MRQDASDMAELMAARVHLRHCDLGSWVRVAGRPRIENEGRIEIGDRTRLVCDFAPVELRTGPHGTIRMGPQGSVNYGTVISARREITIGRGVAIGPYCILSDTEVGEPAGTGTEGARPIEIEDGVWLASGVTVLPGARIGSGAVIPAGSVVDGPIPARVVAGGNPARVLRRLDDTDQGPRSANGSPSSNGANVSSIRNQEERAPAEHWAGGTPAAGARPAIAHRGLLISDFTIDELARCLEADLASPGVAAANAPYGQVVPTLMSAKSPEHDFAVVWTRPEAVLPSFARLIEFEPVEEEALLAEVDQFTALLIEGLKGYRFTFVPTWTVPPWRRGLGVLDARNHGVTHGLFAINQRLIERLRSAPNLFVLNAQRWIDEAGRGAHSSKLWYMGKVPFHTTVFEQATLDIKAALHGLTGMARKLVIVDLDDTLWGGIVGDVGWEQLRLGGHDGIGEAFVDFQKALRSLKRRGVLLAIVSKNDEAVALEAIRSHGEMVLKEKDFVGWRINWQDKAKNVADLVASLNLGLQSTVFIDDNPFERARVREALPEVLVPDWPEDKLGYVSALSSLRCFDSPSRSREDSSRTEMYASERKRDALRTQVGSLDEWLRSLEIKVRVQPLGPANLVRTTQLLNKTNQLNLSTRRLTETELTEWVAQPGHRLCTLTVSDKLGDAGLTGILSLRTEGSTAHIVDFVLSCRVMGRRVEETMVHLAVDAARGRSCDRVVAELIPTAKNKPCLEFWERSGFRREAANRFVWEMQEDYALPDAISLERSV
jgi:FkbH-like protein